MEIIPLRKMYTFKAMVHLTDSERLGRNMWGMFQRLASLRADVQGIPGSEVMWYKKVLPKHDPNSFTPKALFIPNCGV